MTTSCSSGGGSAGHSWKREVLSGVVAKIRPLSPESVSLVKLEILGPRNTPALRIQRTISRAR